MKNLKGRVPRIIQGCACVLKNSGKMTSIGIGPTEADGVDAIQTALRTAKAKLGSCSRALQGKNLLFETTLRFYEMMLDDPELKSGLFSIIRDEKIGASEAITLYFERFMAHMDTKDEYFRNRKYDLEDIRNLMIGSFSEQPESTARRFPLPGNAILVMDTLLATDLARVDSAAFVAVIAARGGRTSHAAIILDSMGIPFVIQKDFPAAVKSGDAVVIDYQKKEILLNGKDRFVFSLSETKKQPCPRPVLSVPAGFIDWYPSVNFVEEGLRVQPETVSGIGLLRTEMDVLSERRFPSEIELYVSYACLAAHMGEKPVLFRLWDIEPDKLPAGCETTVFGAAFLIANPQLAKRQLMALLTVSLDHEIGITFPMVEKQGEIDALRAMIDQCRQEIKKRESIRPFRFRVGTMVETVSLAQGIPSLQNVDYLTIGTNDLVGGFLKIDRHDDRFTEQCFTDPAFLALVATVIDEAGKKGLPLYLCGEAANSPTAVEAFRRLGISRFCPGLAMVEKLRSAIR
jgi:phosphotransferase system enzyme I (PtsI)